MALPTSYPEFLKSIQHYDVGEIEHILKHRNFQLSQMGNYFRHLHNAMPACYILDYTRGRYVFGTENIRNFVEAPLSYFLDGGVELAVGMFHKKDLKVYSEKVIVDNIRFLKSLPLGQHESFVFKCNYRIRTSKGGYRNVLQQSIFIKSTDDGTPLATLGFLTDITQYRNDSKIIQTIEPIINTPNGIRTDIPVLFNTYFSEEKDVLLTPREIEVMKYLCDDLTSEEIAGKIGISRHTVDTYRRSLILKTNSKTVIGVVRYALTNGYV